MTLRRKIADGLRRMARAVDAPRAIPAANLNLPKRRIDSTTGRTLYRDERSGRWVYWRDWVGGR